MIFNKTNAILDIVRGESMNEQQKTQINSLIHIYASHLVTKDQAEVNAFINELHSMSIDDAIDRIIVTLYDLMIKEEISKEDILDNANLIIDLNSEKYTSPEDLVQRLIQIQEMNIPYHKTSLSENHRQTLEAFEEFNMLLNDGFDCYYTGGLMGYITTNAELERFHTDLDLFINEEQLIQLRDLVLSSDYFDFISYMDQKIDEPSGHEFVIKYKDTPMNVGLFLFSRNDDDSITTKEYYYGQGEQKTIYVDENKLTRKTTELTFDDDLKQYKSTTYKMMSLEAIYNSKKHSIRPKDKRDVRIMQPHVNLLIDYHIDIDRKNNQKTVKNIVTNSVIDKIEDTKSISNAGSAKK